MKMRRLLSVLLAVAMIMSILSVGAVVTSAAEVDTAEVAADIDVAAAGSAYSDMLAKTTAANNYGLSQTVNDGTIVQGWNWSFKNIEANLETIAEQGFTTIQVSPPNEIKKGTKGAKVLQSDNQNGWWMYYQPAGFQLNQSTDNALGTKAEFVSMCNKAHQLGLKIIVDAVINHMGTKDGDDNNTSTDPMSHVTPKAATFEPEIYNNKLFHTPWKQMQYIESNNTRYNSTYDLTRNCTSGLPDLKTEDTRVQTAIYDYLNELVTAGADGFRFDAAKHIETPDDKDNLGSSFWTNTLKKVQSTHSEKEVYAYGEILNTCGIDRPYSMYTKLFDVTDSGSYWSIFNAVKNGGTGGVPYYPSSNFTAANTVLWDESHDTYCDGASDSSKGTMNLSVVQRGKIWALVAGRAGISSVYFARPSDNTNGSAMYSITLGDLNKTAWSNATTKAINQFHNYFIGQGEYCTANSNGTAYIERGSTGAMIVNLGGTTSKSVTLSNHKLTPGTYKDAITGSDFTVTSSQIKGNVGSTGVAVIYENTYVAPTEPPMTYILGDVDDDGDVTTFDVTQILRYSIDMVTFTEKQLYAGDVDGDGMVTVIDATFIQRYLAKMNVKFPIGEEQVVKPTEPTTAPLPTTTPKPTTSPNPDPDGRTIIFSNNKGFSSVNIYYWSDSETPVEWPGVPMTYYDTNEYGETRYSFEMPEGMTNYIINDGTQQTVDIPFNGSTGVYMLDTKDDLGHYNVDFYEIIDPTPTPTTGPNPDPDGRTIIFSNNKGFSTVNIYYWSDSDTPVEWPGVPMTYYDTNEYGETRYSFEMPEGMTNYIINDGSQQTVDIPFNGATGVYMLDTKDDLGHYNVDFYEIGNVDPNPNPNPDPTTAPTPDPVEGDTIIFSNNKGFSTVNIYYWSDSETPVEWPGVPMTYYDTNEYGETRYSFNMPAGMTNYIINDGSQQTVDIPFTGATGVYMLDTKDDLGHYNVDFYALDNVDPNPDPDPTPDPTTAPTPDPDPVDGNTIIFSNNKGFSTVNIYYWSDSETPVEWPGVPMTYYDTNDYGETRYSFEMPAGMTNYIINDGTQQTVDIPFNGATGLYMLDTKDDLGHYNVDFYALDNVDPNPDPDPTPDPTTAPTPDPTTAPDPDPVDGNTIIFSNNKGFSTVNIYYWSDSENPVEWPGVAMTYLDTNDYGETRYSFEMPAGMTNYIINDGTQQTVDIPFNGATGVYMLDTKDDLGHYNVDFYALDNVDPNPDPDPTPDPTTAPTPDPTTAPDPDPVDGNTIIFSNNKGFSTVNIYYWSDSENPVEWPGVPMTYYDTNDYGETRYSFEMPAGMTNYIINDGTQQTVDIPFNGATGVYMLDTKDDLGHYNVDFYALDNVDPNPDPDPTPDPTTAPTPDPTTAPDPDPVDGNTIIFSNNKGFSTVNIYYWSDSENPVEWPGVPMTYYDTNDYGETRYSFEMPAGMTNYIINDGSQQTVDIPFTGATGVYMLDTKDDLGHYNVDFYALDNVDPTPDPDPDPTPDPTEPNPDPVSNGTIIFSNNKGFSTVNIYYWADGNTPVQWPGVAMTYLDTNDYGEKRYTFEMPAGMTNYIINDGSQQTIDITYSGSTGVYMLDTKDGQGHYNVGFYEI